MREIKFRVWSPYYREFWYFEVGQEFEWKEDEYPDQFTGLKDKNGKEIYEGDIVQYQEWASSAIKTDVVTMESFPGFWLKNEGFGYEGEELVTPDTTEVIGNIYENPELVKK